MRANNPFFIVEIDLEKQRKLTEPGEGGIIIPEMARNFKYFLQSGPIVSISEVAAKYFPEARVGDILIFHHTVEFDEWRKLETIDKKEKVVVRADIEDVFAIHKLRDNQIIPSKEYLFCEHIKEEEAHLSEAGIIMSAMKEDEKMLRDRQEELKNQIDFMAKSSVAVREENRGLFNELNKERAEINKQLNKPVPVYLTVKISNNPLFKRGDVVCVKGWMGYNGYPLPYNRTTHTDKWEGKPEDFMLIRANMVIGRLV